MRLEAVKELGKIGVAHPKIVELLRSVALSDSSSDVRIEASRSLELLQNAQSNDISPINHSQLQSDNSNQTNDIIGLLQNQNIILENLRTLILCSIEAQNQSGSL